MHGRPQSIWQWRESLLHCAAPPRPLFETHTGCITGGEPTLHPDLPDLIQRIRALGYLVKLDTNGTNPQMLRTLLQDRLIDYCALVRPRINMVSNPPCYYLRVCLLFVLSVSLIFLQFLRHKGSIPQIFRSANEKTACFKTG